MDDQKSQLPQEKQAKKQTYAPAKGRMQLYEPQTVRDVALGRSHQMTYGINSIAFAPGLASPRSVRLGRSDRVEAVRGASLDLSKTPDNADAGDDGGDRQGCKGKGRAEESPPAGIVDVGGDKNGPSRVVQIDGIQEDLGDSEESGDEDGALSDRYACSSIPR